MAHIAQQRQPGNRGHAPHCGFANGLGRLRGNSNEGSELTFPDVFSGRPRQHLSLFSLRAAGVRFGG